MNHNIYSQNVKCSKIYNMEHRRSRKLLIINVILLAAAALLSAAARLAPGFSEWYCMNIYPILQGSLGRLCGKAPFSVGEILCLIVPIAVIADAVYAVVRRKSHAHPLRRFLSHVLLLVSLLAFMYTANCGVNYYRTPFADRTAFDQAAFTEEDLISFCEYSAEQIRKLSEENPEGITYPSGEELADDAKAAMSGLASEEGLSFAAYDRLRGFYPRPKKLTFLSPLFSMMGVSGIYCPFTIEANVNGMMTGLEMPFTSCHELSHLKGFMNEGEANFIGWLACINSGDVSFRRSGWLIAWIYAGNSLYKTDPDMYLSIRETLPPDALAELKENAEFWESHETEASEVQDRVNDAYLKSNGQDMGIMSYGQLTTLMLMWHSENK